MLFSNLISPKTNKNKNMVQADVYALLCVYKILKIMIESPTAWRKGQCNVFFTARKILSADIHCQMHEVHGPNAMRRVK